MRPHAIVLGLGGGGLCAARALARAGVTVHGVSLARGEVGRWSWRCRVVDASDAAGDEERFVAWLEGFARTFPERPVVIPTSDAMALCLARSRARLGRHLRMWSTETDVLESLIEKHRLRDLAARAGVASPPTLVRPKPGDLDAWCAGHAAPYIAKPWYTESPDNPLGGKNRVFADAAGLRAFVAEHAGGAFLVQKMVPASDGRIVSVFGVCDRKGRIAAMTTRHRIVQYPPDRGIVVHGLVPAFPTAGEQEPYFAAARALFGAVVYNGMFGLELLRDPDSGELWLLDANLRSLLSLWHYVSAGFNAPYLDYRLLCGEEPADQPQTPAVRRTYWSDSWRLLGAWSRLRGTGRLGLARAARYLLRSRSFAVWHWRDPLPWLRHLGRHVRLRLFG